MTNDQLASLPYDPQQNVPDNVQRIRDTRPDVDPKEHEAFLMAFLCTRCNELTYSNVTPHVDGTCEPV